MKNTRLCAFLIVFSVLCLLAIPASAIFGSDELGIYDRVVRLHVLADSDEPEEQTLKLKVRDGILELVSTLVADCTDVHEAEARLLQSLGSITEAAENVLRTEGSEHSVRVTLTREKYPTRDYGGVSLPAGEYRSLRVMIGAAEGKNWWCVLFPQLCVTPASEYRHPIRLLDETLIEAGLTPSQIELITGDSPKTVIRFRLLEWLAALSA